MRFILRLRLQPVDSLHVALFTDWLLLRPHLECVEDHFEFRVAEEAFRFQDPPLLAA